IPLGMKFRTVSKVQRNDLEPLPLGEWRHVCLAVIYGEVAPVLVEAEPGTLSLGHLVQDLDAAGSTHKRAGAPTIVNRSLVPVGLSDMVLEIDGAVSLVRDVGELLDHGVNGRIVIFGNAMGGNHRVQDHGIYAQTLNRTYQRVDYRLHYHRAVAGLRCNDDLLIAPAVDEQIAFQVSRLDVVLQAYGRNPTVDFLLRVLTVPVPDFELLYRLDAN